jgi:hypothetical protein
VSDPRRAAQRVAVAAAVAFLLRAAFCVTSARDAGGDEIWFLDVGARLAAGGFDAAPDAFHARGPALPLLVAAGFRAGGDHALLAVRFAVAALSAAAAFPLASIARRAVPHVPWLPVAVAWVHAADPGSIVLASQVLSENLTVLLTPAFVAAALAVCDAPSSRRGALLGAAAALLLASRLDGVFEVATTVLGLALVATARRAWTRRLVGSLAVAVLVALPAALVSAAAAPATESAGPTVLDPARSKAGWGRWLSTVDLPRTDWLRAWWAGPEGVDLAIVPDDMFRSDDERRTVTGLCAAARARSAPREEVDRAFRALADAQVAEEPLRWYVVLPLRRAARVWLDPADTDHPRQVPGVPVIQVTSARGRLLLALVGVSHVLAGVGFLLAHGLCLRPAGPLAVPALVIVGRTYALVGLLAFAWLRPSFAERYVENLRPLALVLVACVAADLGRRALRPRGAARAVP